jgi:antitoxin (DNA-binding transcriptional repressor) of toxin-antitoxin stability system
LKTIEVSEATAPLSTYVEGVGDEPVILTIDGKPVAALVSLQDVDLETLALGRHPQFVQVIEDARARHKREGGISVSEMRRRLGL